MSEPKTYTVTKRFSSHVERTPRVLEVAEAFGLGLDDTEFVIYDELEIPIADQDIVYITGQSGSGKSLLLDDLVAQMIDTENGYSYTVAELDKMPFEDKPLIDQIGKDMNEGLELLSKAGLNDAYLFVRKPQELSDGQKYRFRLAKLIETGAEVWAADEFTSVLDRITARVVAFNLQKVARSVGATVLVATTQWDLREDLNPDLYIEKYYQERVAVVRSDDYAVASGEIAHALADQE